MDFNNLKQLWILFFPNNYAKRDKIKLSRVGTGTAKLLSLITEFGTASYWWSHLTDFGAYIILYFLTDFGTVGRHNA